MRTACLALCFCLLYFSHMRGTVVSVLRGGPSREHSVSLQTGHAFITGLHPERYTVRDIYIDKDGSWHERGRPVTPDQVLRFTDVAIIGLHGEYGEDGEVQKLLERFGTPYTGSDSFASFVAMHKVLAKEKAKEHGLLTPRYAFIEEGSDIEAAVREAVRTFPMPVVVKPVRWGSSVGVSLLTGYLPVYETVRQLLAEGAGGVLIEEYIRGTEATAGVVEGLRDMRLYPLPPVEIVPPESDFFSYESKYNGTSKEICPARLPKTLNEELARQAQVMHDALGLRHYSRSDFIVSPRGIYYLETNTLPGLTKESLFPKSLAAVGVSFPDFVDHVVGLARSAKRR